MRYINPCYVLTHNVTLETRCKNDDDSARLKICDTHTHTHKFVRACVQVIKMLVVVVVLFGVCWLPLHAFMLVIDFNPQLTDYKTPAQKRFFTALYYCVHWLAMSNSFVNPIIYGFLNDCFRVSSSSAAL